MMHNSVLDAIVTIVLLFGSSTSTTITTSTADAAKIIYAATAIACNDLALVWHDEIPIIQTQNMFSDEQPLGIRRLKRKHIM